MTQKVTVNLGEYEGANPFEGSPEEYVRAHKTRGIQEMLRIARAVLFGTGVERNPGEIGLIRQILLKARPFKMAGRYLMWRWPHNPRKQRETLDFGGNSHLAKVHTYTVRKDESQAPRGTTRRAEMHYQILALPPRDLRQEKLLVIGGKNVNELLIAWLYGFSWENIKGIDLFSLHPKIDVMDMENMEYPDATFDDVVMANVYGYQLDPAKCIHEVARVLKPGGRFVLNTANLRDGKLPPQRISANELAAIFKASGLDLLFHYASDRDRNGNTSHYWNLQKRDPTRAVADELSWGD